MTAAPAAPRSRRTRTTVVVVVAVVVVAAFVTGFVVRRLATPAELDLPDSWRVLTLDPVRTPVSSFVVIGASAGTGVLDAYGSSKGGLSSARDDVYGVDLATGVVTWASSTLPDGADFRLGDWAQAGDKMVVIVVSQDGRRTVIRTLSIATGEVVAEREETTSETLAWNIAAYEAGVVVLAESQGDPNSADRWVSATVAYSDTDLKTPMWQAAGAKDNGELFGYGGGPAVWDRPARVLQERAVLAAAGGYVSIATGELVGIPANPAHGFYNAGGLAIEMPASASLSPVFETSAAPGGAAPNTAQAWAVDTPDHPRWTYTPADEWLLTGPPVCQTSGLVLFPETGAAQERRVTAVDPRDGSVKWRYASGRGLTDCVAVGTGSDQVLVFQTEASDTTLTVIDAATGTPLGSTTRSGTSWSLDACGSVAVCLANAAGEQRGKLEALGTPALDPLWSAGVDGCYSSTATDAGWVMSVRYGGRFQLLVQGV
ncbi:MAG: hypothetical protein LBI33_09310 [Propionibacteriaceae bacterium]|nr:hypothetical protein [Propionibacteriaceae bacterium]